MKRLTAILLLAGLYLAACNSAHNKTGGATQDSSASHGNGGPADTTTKTTGQSATSTGSSDTSKLGNAATYPATDTVKKPKP